MSRTWLVVAAEKREFDGIIKHFGGAKSLNWPAQFAAQSDYQGDRWLLLANGPGKDCVDQALTEPAQVDAIVSTGFCGALDPALKIGDIVRDLHTSDRVAVTAAEKRQLHQRTKAP